jgi:hypothetical protein
VTLEEVITIMRQNNGKAFSLLKRILNAGPALLKNCNCADQGLRTGLMTPREALNGEQKKWMQVLLE